MDWFASTTAPDSERLRQAIDSALSYLGLIPFIAGILVAWAPFPELRAQTLTAVAIYGAVHWGRVITGAWDGQILVLDEVFRYDDGETDRRTWTR